MNSLDAAPVTRRNLLLASTSALAVAFPATASAQTTPPAPSPAGSRLDAVLKSQKLRVGTNLLSKPYTFKNAAGEADGWDTDVAKALAMDMGVKPEFIDTPWDGIIPALLANKFDVIIAAMANTVKRSLTINFTIPYHFVLSAFIYRSADAEKLSSLAKFNDPSLTVGSELGGAHRLTLNRFFPRMKVTEFNTIADVLLAIEGRKVNVAIAEYTVLTEHIANKQGFAVKAVDYPGSMFPIAMGLLPGPDNDHLKTFLNIWTQHFYWSGQFEPIRKKWFPNAPLPKLEKFVAPL